MQFFEIHEFQKAFIHIMHLKIIMQAKRQVKNFQTTEFPGRSLRNTHIQPKTKAFCQVRDHFYQSTEAGSSFTNSKKSADNEKFYQEGKWLNFPTEVILISDDITPPDHSLAKIEKKYSVENNTLQKPYSIDQGSPSAKKLESFTLDQPIIQRVLKVEYTQNDFYYLDYYDSVRAPIVTNDTFSFTQEAQPSFEPTLTKQLDTISIQNCKKNHLLRIYSNTSAQIINFERKKANLLKQQKITPMDSQQIKKEVKQEINGYPDDPFIIVKASRPRKICFNGRIPTSLSRYKLKKLEKLKEQREILSSKPLQVIPERSAKYESKKIERMRKNKPIKKSSFERHVSDWLPRYLMPIRSRQTPLEDRSADLIAKVSPMYSVSQRFTCDFAAMIQRKRASLMQRQFTLMKPE